MYSESLLIYSNGEATGDGAVHLPFLSTLRAALPTARIIWLAEGQTVYATSMADMIVGLIDDLWILSPPDERFEARRVPKNAFSQRFDTVVDVRHYLQRTMYLKWKLKHRTFISPTWNYLFSDRKPDPDPNAAFGRSIAGRLMQLATLVAGRPLDVVSYTVDPIWARRAAALLPDGGRYLGFVPGASTDYKKWPLDRYIALAQRQTDRGYTPVFLIGPDERAMEPVLKRAVPNALFPLGGDSPIGPGLTVALAQRFLAAVANDGGGGNLVSIGECPMVMLYRADHVRAKYAPLRPSAVSLTPEDYPNGRKGMIADIPADAVETALDTLLQKQG